MPTITHRDLPFTFPADALGGTSNAHKLKPADELLLNWLAEQEVTNPVAVYHDRDGVLSTCLFDQKRTFLSDNVTHQQAALEHLLTADHPGRCLPDIGNPLEPLTKEHDLVVMQIPKSPDLFELYLAGIAALAGPGRKVAAAFQTRHFNLLNDLQPGKIPEELYHQLSYGGRTYYQYYGVFSAKHIDYATQFMLDEWATNHLLSGLPAPGTLLDIGCGCGVIADHLAQRYPDARLLATDVSRTAIASTIQNNSYIRAELTDSLSFVAPGGVDLIVTNPPFHDGHRNAIEPTLQLFREAKEKLSERGHLVVVANRHLNYATHLDRLFSEVIEVADNGKFMVYRCGQD